MLAKNAKVFSSNHYPFVGLTDKHTYNNVEIPYGST